MTECMPVTSPPVDYDLSRAGTSGVTCGPELAVLDDRGNWELTRCRRDRQQHGRPWPPHHDGYIYVTGLLER